MIVEKKFTREIAETMSGEVIIPDGITTIGLNTFAYCGLERVTIPARVAEISPGAFSYTNIEKIIVSPENRNYCDVDGVLLSKDKTMLHTYPHGRKQTDYVIPDTVIHIGEYAFLGCRLENVLLPGGVKHIGDGAFRASDLHTITIPDSVVSIGATAFSENYNLKGINVHPDNPHFCDIDGVIFNKDGTVLHSFPFYQATDYVIPDGVKHIGEAAFFRSRLRTVAIPDSVISIGAFAFRECNKFRLRHIAIPAGVKTIGFGAFDFSPSISRTIDGALFPGYTRVITVGFDSYGPLDYVVYYSSPLTIHGAPGSAAERYALEYNIRFAIDRCKS